MYRGFSPTQSQSQRVCRCAEISVFTSFTGKVCLKNPCQVWRGGLSPTLPRAHLAPIAHPGLLQAGNRKDCLLKGVSLLRFDPKRIPIFA